MFCLEYLILLAPEQCLCVAGSGNPIDACQQAIGTLPFYQPNLEDKGLEMLSDLVEQAADPRETHAPRADSPIPLSHADNEHLAGSLVTSADPADLIANMADALRHSDSRQNLTAMLSEMRDCEWHALLDSTEQTSCPTAAVRLLRHLLSRNGYHLACDVSAANTYSGTIGISYGIAAQDAPCALPSRLPAVITLHADWALLIKDPRPVPLPVFIRLLLSELYRRGTQTVRLSAPATDAHYTLSIALGQNGNHALHHDASATDTAPTVVALLGGIFAHCLHSVELHVSALTASFLASPNGAPAAGTVRAALKSAGLRKLTVVVGAATPALPVHGGIAVDEPAVKLLNELGTAGVEVHLELRGHLLPHTAAVLQGARIKRLCIAPPVPREEDLCELQRLAAVAEKFEIKLYDGLTSAQMAMLLGVDLPELDLTDYLMKKTMRVTKWCESVSTAAACANPQMNGAPESIPHLKVCLLDEAADESLAVLFTALRTVHAASGTRLHFASQSALSKRAAALLKRVPLCEPASHLAMAGPAHPAGRQEEGHAHAPAQVRRLLMAPFKRLLHPPRRTVPAPATAEPSN